MGKPAPDTDRPSRARVWPRTATGCGLPARCWTPAGIRWDEAVLLEPGFRGEKSRFSGRYKACEVDDTTLEYRKTVCDYVPLNPGQPKLVRTEDALQAFAGSSFAESRESPTRRQASVEKLVRRKWMEADLAGKPKTDRRKTRRALRLWRKTAMTSVDCQTPADGEGKHADRSAANSR